MRVIVSGGGTGGHIYPALAIAEALKTNYNAEIIYMGAKQDLHGGPPRERELAEHAGWIYRGVSATGLTRRSLRIFKDVIVNYRGMFEAKEYIRRFGPHVVVGTGGYAMAPVLRAAEALRVPTLLHEQNAFPGWANRYLAKKAGLVCLTFAAARPHFPAGTRLSVTGLPVRREIMAASREAAYAFWGVTGAEKERPTLLVTGGSQGAQRLNEAICSCYSQLLEAGLRIIHLTGENHAEACRAAAQKVPRQENLHVLPYLKEMQHALALADLVVGRAGASFLSELAVLGRPAILVPYPYAAGDHQTRNAEAFCQAGAARMIKNEDLNGESLSKLVLELTGDKTRRQQMAAAAQSLAKPQAAEDIAREIEKLAKRR